MKKIPTGVDESYFRQREQHEHWRENEWVALPGEASKKTEDTEGGYTGAILDCYARKYVLDPQATVNH